MKNEIGAYNIYLDEEQKKIFIELMKMEQMHKVRLEDVYVTVAYGEVW